MGLNNLHVRWLMNRDMEQIFEIEHQSFEWPWSADDFYKSLQHTKRIGLVAELDEKVVGYMIYEFKRRRYEVLNLAVNPEFRRQHVGTTLINKLITKLSFQKRNRIIMDVSEDNFATHLFLKKMNFNATEVMRCFYEINGRDAYRFEYNVESAVPVRELVFEELGEAID